MVPVSQIVSNSAQLCECSVPAYEQLPKSSENTRGQQTSGHPEFPGLPRVGQTPLFLLARTNPPSALPALRQGRWEEDGAGLSAWL